MQCTTQQDPLLQAVLGLARQARGCDLKLAAVREMLGEQAAELQGQEEWGSDDVSPRADSDELPHRDEAPPQRIVQVRPRRAAHACVCDFALLCAEARPDRATLSQLLSGYWQGAGSPPLWAHCTSRPPCQSTRSVSLGVSMLLSLQLAAGCCTP